MRITDALKLFNEGVNALARVTSNGFRLDMDYLAGLEPRIKTRIDELSCKITEETEIGRMWKARYGSSINLSSGNQFKDVLKKDVGFTQFKLTKKGGESADSEVIGKLPRQFASQYLQYKQMEQLYGLYVEPLLIEVSNKGFVHANFPLHRVKTYRGSCHSPNIQQVPSRNREMMRLIRSCYIPREPGRVLVDMDLKGAECSIGACIHGDPAMLAYMTDDSLDMHRDGACLVYMLDKERINKPIRNACKGDFTFAEFYGANFHTVAPRLWEYVLDDEFKTADGKKVSSHLSSKGIEDLDGFIHHIQKVESDFWGKMFPGYSQWKEDVWQQYLIDGFAKVATGFVLTLESRKEQILNAPIQGPSFHFLLKMLIGMQERMIKRNMKSLIIAQIHDAITFDAVPEEIENIKSLYKEVHDDIHKQWKWLRIPIRAEMEIGEIGGSWAEMTEVGLI